VEAGAKLSKVKVNHLFSDVKKNARGSTDFALAPSHNSSVTSSSILQSAQVLKAKKKAMMMYGSPLAAAYTPNMTAFNPSPSEQSNSKNDRTIGNIKKNKLLPPRPKGKSGGAAPGIVQVTAAT
jgi:hypothetical protein